MAGAEDADGRSVAARRVPMATSGGAPRPAPPRIPVTNLNNETPSKIYTLVLIENSMFPKLIQKVEKLCSGNTISQGKQSREVSKNYNYSQKIFNSNAECLLRAAGQK